MPHQATVGDGGGEDGARRRAKCGRRRPGSATPGAAPPTGGPLGDATLDVGSTSARTRTPRDAMGKDPVIAVTTQASPAANVA